MPRTNRTQQLSRDADRTPPVVRTIARQLRRLSDADVYALTFSGDRQTRGAAMQEAHERAEQAAMESERS